MNQLRSRNYISLFHDVLLIGEHWVDNDSIIIDLTNLIKMSEIVETDFIILRYEEITHFTADSHIDVCKSSIHVNEHYIIVEDKQVDDKEAQMNNKC